MMMLFKNRIDAGIQLAKEVKNRNFKNPVILALPRGGVPVAFEIAKVLKAPLDVLLVRKLGQPTHPELAIGAIAEDRSIWWNEELKAHFKNTSTVLKELQKQEWGKIQQMKEQFRNGKSLPELKNETIILVDDGIATGATVMAGLNCLKKTYPQAKLAVATPICSLDAATQISEMGIELIAVKVVEALNAIGSWYLDFDQVVNTDVIDHLRAAKDQRL